MTSMTLGPNRKDGTVEINCSYIQTPETHKELRWQTLNWPLLAAFSGTMIVMIVAMVAGGIYGVIQENKVLMWYCFIVALAIFIPSLQIPMVVIRHIKMPKRFGQVNAVFHDDRIEIKGKRKSSSKTYDYIKAVKETENFFIIVFEDEKKEMSYLPIKKDGLDCDHDTFKQFIENKIANRKESEKA